MRDKELQHTVDLENEQLARLDAEQDVAAARASLATSVLDRVRKTTPDDTDVEPVDEGGVRGEWVSSPLGTDNRVAILLHGGAWAFGSAEQSRELARRLSWSAQSRVLSLDFRMPPEHPYPAGVDDVVHAFEWLVSDGADPREIALVGESTGATLALAAAIRLRDAAGATPGALALMSPVLDLGPATTGDDPISAWALIDRYADDYAGDAGRDDRGVSPARAELRDLPSMAIQAGSQDPVLEQARRFAEQAEAAGVDVSFSEWDGAVHRWQVYPHIYDAARATNLIGEYLLQRIGPGYVPVPRGDEGSD